MADPALRIVYMGTPEFAVAPLHALIGAGYRPVTVVTTPDRESGRGREPRPSAVKTAALEEGLPIMQPESLKNPEFLAGLEALKPDVIAVVAFRILPREVYSTARRGAFNLHASLLPAFRGAAPIQRALMHGVRKTGVTTFFLEPSVDTGDIILQRSLGVGPDETAGELHDRMAELGADAVVETVRLIERGEANPLPQDDAIASSAPKIFKDDMRIDWSRPATEVHNLVRALAPSPGAWTTHGGETLKIYRTTVGDETVQRQSGTVLAADDKIVVACGVGAVEVHDLQRGGRRRMTSREFLHGYPLSVGEVLR